MANTISSSLNISFNNPYIAASSQRGIDIKDLLINNNDIFILEAQHTQGSSFPILMRYRFANNEFQKLTFNHSIQQCQSVINGNLELQGTQIIVRLSINRFMAPIGNFEIIFDINTGQEISNYPCGPLTFFDRNLLQPIRPEIINHNVTNIFFRDQIAPRLIANGIINNTSVFILLLGLDSVLELPPHCVSNYSYTEKLILATYTNMKSEALILKGLLGADERIEYNQMHPYEFSLSNGRQAEVAFSVYSDQQIKKVTVELAEDSLFNKIKTSSDFMNFDTLFFNVKNKIAPAIYKMRLKIETPSQPLFSNIVTVKANNTNYIEYQNKKCAFWMNSFLIVGSLLICYFLIAIIHYPSLKEYQFNFLSPILNNENAGPVVVRILWWLIFTVYIIGFLYYKVFNATLELIKFLRS
jgi:hypothetical protein